MDARPRRSSPIEDNGCADLVLSPADERDLHHPGGRQDSRGGGDDIRVVVLDVLEKGSPPPPAGDPSPGRNHVIGFGDGVEKDVDGGIIRVDVKGAAPPSAGDSSNGRNRMSMTAAVSVSVSHGVSGHGSDDGEQRTGAVTAGSHGGSPNFNHEQ